MTDFWRPLVVGNWSMVYCHAAPCAGSWNAAGEGHCGTNCACLARARERQAAGRIEVTNTRLQWTAY